MITIDQSTVVSCRDGRATLAELVYRMCQHWINKRIQAGVCEHEARLNLLHSNELCNLRVELLTYMHYVPMHESSIREFPMPGFDYLPSPYPETGMLVADEECDSLRLIDGNKVQCGDMDVTLQSLVHEFCDGFINYKVARLGHTQYEAETLFHHSTELCMLYAAFTAYYPHVSPERIRAAQFDPGCRYEGYRARSCKVSAPLSGYGRDISRGRHDGFHLVEQ